MKFKKFLCSAFALSVLTGCFYSTAYAESYNNGNIIGVAKTKSWSFGSSVTTGKLTEGDTVDGITIDSEGEGANLTETYLSLRPGSKISIPVPEGSAGALYITGVEEQADRTATLEGNSVSMSASRKSVSFTADETADGDLDISFDGGEFKATEFMVYITNDKAFDALVTYSLTGSCTGLDADRTFEITNGDNTYLATVNSDGKSFHINFVSSDENVGFDTTKTYTASLRNYYVSYGSGNGFTVAKNDDGSYSTNTDIAFEKATFTAIPGGTYGPEDIDAGLPYFDMSELEKRNSAGNYRGTIDIKTSAKASVKIIGTCGSSDSEKSVTLSFGDINETINGGTASKSYKYITDGAETVSINMDSTTTTFKITAIVVDYSDTTESVPVTTETITDMEKLTVDAEDMSTANALALPTDDKFVTTEDMSSGSFVLLSGITVDEAKKTVEGIGSFTHRIKLNGATVLENGVPANRAIKFTTDSEGVLQVTSLSATSTEDRSWSVYNSEGELIATQTAPAGVSGAVPKVSDIITLPKADTYYIACPEKACNFYSVNVVTGKGLEKVENGSVFADKTNSYIIVPVDKTTAEENDEIVVSLGKNGTTDSTSKIYEKAVIDNVIVTPEDIGSDYMYVIKIKDSAGNDVSNFTATAKVRED